MIMQDYYNHLDRTRYTRPLVRLGRRLHTIGAEFSLHRTDTVRPFDVDLSSFAEDAAWFPELAIGQFSYEMQSHH